MAVECREYFAGIPIPFSKKELTSETPVSERQALIFSKSRSYKGKIIELFVTSGDSLSCIQDVSERKSPPVEKTISRMLKGEEINKANIQVRHTRFKRLKYTWEK